MNFMLIESKRLGPEKTPFLERGMSSACMRLDFVGVVEADGTVWLKKNRANEVNVYLTVDDFFRMINNYYGRN